MYLLIPMVQPSQQTFQQINKRIKRIMTTYKEQYQNRLKKTEPLKTKHKSNTSTQPKQHAKIQKVTTIKTTPLNKKFLKDRYHTQTQQNFKIQVQSSKTMAQRKQQKNENLSSKTSIHERAHSVSIVQKFTPSPNYEPLSYPRKSTIQSLERINILSSVQNFFNRIIKPDNGCICEQPCQWASKLFKWIDVPEFRVIEHYEQLKEKVQKRLKHHKDQLRYFESIQDQKIDKEIQKSFVQIKKDITRTQSDSATFQTQLFRQMLENVLRCYVIQDVKIGYVQGMNMILAGILYHVKDQAKSYGIFRRILYYMRDVYLDSFRKCYVHINRIQELIKQHIFDVYMALGNLQIELHMICLPWVLSLLTSIIPLDSIHLVYDGFMKDKWNFIYRICLSIFVYFKERIREATEASEVLMMFSPGQDQFKEIDWEDIVKYGEKIQVNFPN